MEIGRMIIESAIGCVLALICIFLLMLLVGVQQAMTEKRKERDND